jgi:hypothetical protein
MLFYARDQANDNEVKNLPVTGLNTVVMDKNTLMRGTHHSRLPHQPPLFAKNDLTSGH